MKPMTFKAWSLFLILTSQAAVSSAQTRLPFQTVVNISDYKGSTFFSLMDNQIKPALDTYATNGATVVNGDLLDNLLSQVNNKVSRNAISDAGTIFQLKTVATRLNSLDKKISFYDLPGEIAKAGGVKDRFGLSTFYSLMSGNGVAVKINENNITYNVNYGTGKVAKDEMTGRSFGESFNRLALDASDSHYLNMLEKYVRSSDTNVEYFYKSILDILLNNDTTNFSSINADGQAVATDFVAVYIAEQDRHLMVHLKSHHWDRALLEVTLLSAFHAGQTELKVMYNGSLAAQTFKQQSGCSTDAKVAKPASMVDYWQFSNSTNPESCNRSGINVTNRDFKKLGKMITSYEWKKNPALVKKVTRHFSGIKQTGNVFEDLASFLISYKTPSQLSPEQLELSADFAQLLMQIRADADAISN